MPLWAKSRRLAVLQQCEDIVDANQTGGEVAACPDKQQCRPDLAGIADGDLRLCRDPLFDRNQIVQRDLAGETIECNRINELSPVVGESTCTIFFTKTTIPRRYVPWQEEVAA
ncbi:hypothetical protein [Candidatus Chloroploca sp. Khr17]|uniref:hypothetical protein n=1 Tax=Candidatus Chloroploca sp. Khr17 TaxID=2496869 RepID=UPI00101BE39E|nr:hypothetical protein [Candidatus Chloroploca sp. Khr17]